jgi:4-hydroxy-tetrahydrodipicolinate synthase
MRQLKIGPINAATPTPLKPDGSFDRASAKRLCRRWIDQKLDGVFLLGTMGEGAYLSDRTRNEFVELALEEAGDQTTILVNVADASRARMQERALRYAKMGAHCIVTFLPGYQLPPSFGIAAVRAVADACPVPCGYYEYPVESGTALVLSELLQILSHPNIVVYKDSSINPLIAQGITSKEFRPKHVKLLDGVEYHAPRSCALGYDGILHGGGVMNGLWVRRIWDLTAAGRVKEAMELDRAKALFFAQVSNRFNRPVQNIIGLKYVLKLLGHLDSETVAIDQSLTQADRQRIARAVKQYRKFIE